jgi:predicted O-methyltransferase YrrM
VNPVDLAARATRPLRQDLRWVWALRGCAPRTLRFHWRARRHARRRGDEFSLASATRPADLRVLLELCRGRRQIVELGTATGWTAITMALEDPRRRVDSYDVTGWPEREHYLKLAGPRVRAQVRTVIGPGSTGPAHGHPVDLLYVDSSHEREQTIAEVEAWLPHLAPGAAIVFDDYSHPGYPGVREAIEALGLSGSQRGTLYVHLRRGT